MWLDKRASYFERPDGVRLLTSSVHDENRAALDLFKLRSGVVVALV